MVSEAQAFTLETSLPIWQISLYSLVNLFQVFWVSKKDQPA